MGFKSVYRTLQELFPQVDARLLKAAAIEHSKDPDGAVEFILTEVIPLTVEKFDASSSFNKTLTVASSADVEKQCSSASASSSKHESAAACEADIGAEVMNTLNCVEEPPCLNERVQDPLDLTFYDAKDFTDQMSGNTGSKECTISDTLEKTDQEISYIPITKDVDNGDSSRDPININSKGTSEITKYRDLDLSTLALSASLVSSLPKDAVSIVGLSRNDCGSDCDLISFDSNVAPPPESQKKQPTCDSVYMYGPNDVELTLLSVIDHNLEPSIRSNVESVTSDYKLGFSEHSCNDGNAFREDIQVLDNANPDELTSVHSSVTQSGQVCNTDLLENMIEESKSHKKSLLSDMESVLKLMKDVEIQENAAKQSKKESGERGLEIRAKVDELKRTINRAREANDMHSGEVYGERAILATEMKELESRLIALSDVKEKSLSILDAMRKTLETQMAAAEMERIAAEQENYKREESDKKALAEQELFMEKLIEESKKLQQEAEENSRLREFLVDRGRVVDMLQGEISVICHDVKLLKEKFDNGVPLSQSVSSDQKSSILTSSGSSQKSMHPEQLLKLDQPKSILSADPFILPSVEQGIAISHNEDELLDEGWELFEDAAED